MRAVAVLALAAIGAAWSVGLIGAAAVAPDAPGPDGFRNVPSMVGLAPRDRPVRILFAGTSLTADGDWPDRVGAALDACAPHGVTVERLARPGASLRWGLPALRARLARAPAPDIVVAEFAINDAVVLRGLPWPLMERDTRRLVAAIESAGAVAVLATMSPAWGLDALERPGLARYIGVYRTVAVDAGAGLVDTAPAFAALPPDERAALVPDGLHPTDAAQARIVVPAMLDVLLPLVCGDGAAGED